MEVEGSSFVIDADIVIQAIGTSPNPLLVRLLPGAATVILAMGTGKRAAAAIDADLRASGPA